MLGVRWHAVTVLANATGHQLSCTFGSVLRFLGTISQQQHHGWGARGKGQNPPVATPHPGFLHLHWADIWQSSETTLTTWGSALPAHSQEAQPSFPWGCCRDGIWAALLLLALLLHAGVGTVASSSWHLCVPTLVLLLGAAQHLQRAQTSPPAFSKPRWGAARVVKGFSFLPSTLCPPWVAMTEDRMELEPLMFTECERFLNVAGNDPNSSSTKLLPGFPSSNSMEMWELLTSSSSFTGSHWILPAVRKQQVWELVLGWCLLSSPSLSGGIFVIWEKNPLPWIKKKTLTVLRLKIHSTFYRHG